MFKSMRWVALFFFLSVSSSLYSVVPVPLVAGLVKGVAAVIVKIAVGITSLTDVEVGAGSSAASSAAKAARASLRRGAQSVAPKVLEKTFDLATQNSLGKALATSAVQGTSSVQQFQQIMSSARTIASSSSTTGSGIKISELLNTPLAKLVTPAQSGAAVSQLTSGLVKQMISVLVPPAAPIIQSGDTIINLVKTAAAAVTAVREAMGRGEQKAKAEQYKPHSKEVRIGQQDLGVTPTAGEAHVKKDAQAQQKVVQNVEKQQPTQSLPTQKPQEKSEPAPHNTAVPAQQQAPSVKPEQNKKIQESKPYVFKKDLDDVRALAMSNKNRIGREVPFECRPVKPTMQPMDVLGQQRQAAHCQAADILQQKIDYGTATEQDYALYQRKVDQLHSEDWLVGIVLNPYQKIPEKVYRETYFDKPLWQRELSKFTTEEIFDTPALLQIPMVVQEAAKRADFNKELTKKVALMQSDTAEGKAYCKAVSKLKQDDGHGNSVKKVLEDKAQQIEAKAQKIADKAQSIKAVENAQRAAATTEESSSLQAPQQSGKPRPEVPSTVSTPQPVMKAGEVPLTTGGISQLPQRELRFIKDPEKLYNVQASDTNMLRGKESGATRLHSVYKEPGKELCEPKKVNIAQRDGGGLLAQHITQQTYTVSPWSKQVLAQSNIQHDIFEQCTGNPLQQALHVQAIHLLNGASQQQSLHNADKIVIAKLARNGVESAKVGYMEQAQSYIDLGRAWLTVQKCGQVIINGTIKGVGHVQHALTNWQEMYTSLRELVSISADMPCVLATVAHKHTTQLPLDTIYGEQYMKMVAARVQAFEQVAKNVAAMTVPEMVEEAIAQGVSTVLLGGVFKGVGTVTQLAAVQAARVTQPLVKIAKATEAYQKIASTAESIQASLARSRVQYLGEKAEAVIADMELKIPTSSLMEAEQAGVGGAKASNKAAKIVKDTLKAGEKLKNNYSLLEKFVSASKSTQELLAKHGNEVRGIIEGCTDKCKSIGLPAPSVDTIQHIISGHMEGGARLLHRRMGKLRSVFNSGEDCIKLGIEAWEKGKEISPGLRSFDFGRSVGKSLITGENLSEVRVFVNNGRWITTFPFDKAF